MGGWGCGGGGGARGVDGSAVNIDQQLDGRCLNEQSCSSRETGMTGRWTEERDARRHERRVKIKITSI